MEKRVEKRKGSKFGKRYSSGFREKMVKLHCNAPLVSRAALRYTSPKVRFSVEGSF